jgi:hypothetical protein
VKLLHWVYPSLVGILLGLLQTGLFFQLTFTLSSSFRTFLMITVCWLLGSAVGIWVAKRVRLHLNGFALLTLCTYFACAVLLGLAPFNTQLWPVYGVFIMLMGLYPGVFFVRLGEFYTARQLFLRENNGFIIGLVTGTLMFLVIGRAALWGMPVVVAALVMVCTTLLFAGVRVNLPDDKIAYLVEEAA